MTYQIVKNKPFPGIKRGTRSKYPFSKMKVGDAFEVTDKPCNPKVRNVLASAARQYARHHNPKAAFATRIVDGSLWIWRTA